MNKLDISYDILYDLYIIQNKTSDEVANLLNINRTTFFRKIKQYNIIKTDELKSQILKTHNAQKIHIDESKIIDYYINQNHTKQDTALFFNISSATVGRILKSNNIKKDKQMSQINRQESTLNNNGYTCALSGDKRKEIQQNINEAAWSKEAREKRLNTNIATYGFDSPMHNKDIKDKLKNTVMERYGVDCILKSDMVKNKIKQTNTERYGSENFATSLLTPKAQETLKSKENFYQYIMTTGYNTTSLISNDLECAQSTIIIYLHKYDLWDFINSQDSHYETDISNLLNSLNVKNYKTKKIIAPLEIDCYCPEYNIGIEFNGDYWHSSLKKTKLYHFEKSKLAESKEIRLIHIWEHELNNPKLKPIIESLLKIAFGKVNNRIYARNCEIQEITNEQAKPFNDINHLQGHRNAQITYGLFYKDELVQLMSFSKTRYNRNLKQDNSWEIIRGCPGSNNIVVGGVSKLFKHFIREQNPDYVFSYCDFNKFDGKGYEAIGMKFIGYTGPDMKWLMADGSVIARSPSRHKELKENSVAQIWGSGSKKYLWTKPSQS